MTKRRPLQWMLDFVEIGGGVVGACLMELTVPLRIKVSAGHEIAGFIFAAAIGWLLAWLIDRRKPATTEKEIDARRRNWQPRFALAAFVATFVNVVIQIAPELIRRFAA